MKYYDFTQAKNLIKEAIPRGLQKAHLGMAEDWFWTSETIWEDGFFNWNSEDNYIAGIDRSTWATPILMLTFKDDSTEKHLCYFE